MLPQIRKTGGYGISGAQTAGLAELDAVNTFVKESAPRVKLLVSENARLRQMNLLYQQMEKLREQLARKNTPLAEDERRRICILSKSWTVAEIARYTGRSPTAIRNAIKNGGAA